MTKNQATEVVIHSPTHGYWQCGIWAPKISGATKYRDEMEARTVAALRNLPRDIIILPAYN